MNLSNQEPTEVQINIKVKIEIYRKKNKKGILVIALNPKIFYMRFLTAHLKRTLIKKIIDIKDTQKCIKYQEIFVLSGSSLHCNMSKTC